MNHQLNARHFQPAILDKVPTIKYKSYAMTYPIISSKLTPITPEKTAAIILPYLGHWNSHLNSSKLPNNK